MEKKVKVKFIVHCEFEDKTFLALLDTKQRIKGKVINFIFDSKIFDKFKYYHPTILLLTNASRTKSKEYTLNLIIGTNIYHIFSWSLNPFLFELLFYNENNLKITVNNEEIKEYDEYGKFKRVSLINANRNSIMINETKINPFDFLEYIDVTSYQLSFYDIKNNYIVSKKITSLTNMDFETFYIENICSLKLFDEAIDNLKSMKDEFDTQLSELYENYRYIYPKVETNLNLFLPKNILLNMLNDQKYYEFFYSFVKIKIFYYFNRCVDKNKDNFIKLFEFFNKVYEQLKGQQDLEIFEKITILLGYKFIFSEYNSCEGYFKANLYYVKLKNAEEKSVIDLSMKFLNKYINGLNEESPSFFNLVEINSGIGYYSFKEVFTYDIIPINYLKKHLIETLPSVIIFYNEKDTKNIAMTENIIGSICVNEAKIFGEYEKIKMDLYYPNEKISKINDISMKLSKSLMHECFGHTKIQIHSMFSLTPQKETPIKCFENKKLKTLGNVNRTNEENVINVLHGDEKKVIVVIIMNHHLEN